ncbi:unnamed protein product [Darwinula stevensoni]|uniref:BCL2/adenovirus E1B 19 kDa protein-interacting protein 3 n=1 Tax=Darwinula stevensoni TaxID=69355 RepID=A0A7R9A1M7_9CRUS|nr:unnamed protein product [Darwinula stevensoni]CAG0886972.1 unnamed protein product [Darwinula stevensoni]
MSSTPPSMKGSRIEESLGESWVDLALQQNAQSPGRVTPMSAIASEEYLRLLREAQRESNQSSARVSVASSARHSPRESPKSPPNSPNTEFSVETEELKSLYINDHEKELKNADWVWDWSSRPDLCPPKEWKFKHPDKKTYSIRNARVGKQRLFSKEVLYTLVITNIMSLIIGTGIGLWLSRRGYQVAALALD